MVKLIDYTYEKKHEALETISVSEQTLNIVPEGGVAARGVGGCKSCIAGPCAAGGLLGLCWSSGGSGGGGRGVVSQGGGGGDVYGGLRLSVAGLTPLVGGHGLGEASVKKIS